MTRLNQLAGLWPESACQDPHYQRLMAQHPGCAVYVVGGAVRDALLGLPLQDRDWVVVGASPAAMLEAGFKPVGQDFPVFLHPVSHEEYALARTERKTAAGYQGFQFHAAPDVSLEDDLRRRDLTINAMAVSVDGQLHDPYGGAQDLAASVLRHVSPAFREDPVRLLRLARFHARLWSEQTPWTIAPETLALCQQMVAEGEVNALVAERVWQEIARGLMTLSPSKMLLCLVQTGAWQVIAGVDALVLIPEARLNDVAVAGWPLAWRWLAWWRLACEHVLAGAGSLPQLVAQHDQLCQRWRVPTMCQDLSGLWLKLLQVQQHWVGGEHQDSELLELLEACDIWRRPERLAIIQAVERILMTETVGQLRHYLQRLQHADVCVDQLRHLPMADVVTAARQRGEPVPQAVRTARLQALTACLKAYLP